MSRTVQTSPLPVHLQSTTRVSTYEAGKEKDRQLPASSDLCVVIFQSQHLWHLRDHDPLVTGIEANETKQIIVLRDPFNWSASYMQKSQHTDDTLVWPKQWKEYADEYLGLTRLLPNAVKVNYNKWFENENYRRQISTQLGLEFTDQTLEVVTSHAGGSSFDQTTHHGSAQNMGVTERWKTYKDDPRYVNVFRERPDIIEMAEKIFSLPPELAEFAAMCKS